MLVVRIIGITAAGLTAWLLRLVFVASVAAGIYGVYLAWFASLGRSDPGPDRLAGTGWMALALGAGLVSGVTLLCVPPLRRHAGAAWYSSTFILFATVFITTLWPLSGALCSIGTWERSNTQVVGIATGCATQVDDNGDATYSCDLAWSVQGHSYSQNRWTDGAYPDGTGVQLWVDPATGGADDHDWVPVFWGFLGTGAGLIIDAIALSFCTNAIGDDREGPRAWARDMAWWRDYPKRKKPSPAPEPARAAEIEDAIPSRYRPEGVEDAHP